MAVRVATGGRLHFGFCNLSLSRERLYGSVGVSLATPRVVVEAEPASEVVVDCTAASRGTVGDDTPASPGRSRRSDGGVAIEAAGDLERTVRRYVRRATERFDVPGVAVRVRGSLPRHVGLGSGTQYALATVRAVAAAHGERVDVRAVAPHLGRGGRSGVGVAAFERGGLVVDDGQPVDRFSAGPPATGDWSVPSVSVRRDLPASWRFVLVRPAVQSGRDGAAEDESMRRVIERATPSRADELRSILSDALLPAVESNDVERFGVAVERFNRTNGAWYAGEQGGVYRPPVGDVVGALSADPAVFGAGQSSWGPLVFGVTTASAVEAARAAGERALDAAGVPGTVRVAAPSNSGASVDAVGE